MDLASRGKHIIRWIECTGVTANRWWTSRPPPSRPAPRTLVRCEAREHHTFRKKVIFKALMYSHVVWWLEKHYWADSECARSLGLARSTPSLTLDPSHCRFHCCLTTSSCYTAFVASIEVFYDCELLCLDGLLYVISGILAGADPWFPHSDVLHSLDGMAMWFLCFCVLFCLFLPYQYLSWYNAITSPHH